jgi:hypothetical protein
MFVSRRWQLGLQKAGWIRRFLEPPAEAPNRFVLLSTPRSGTTWTLDLLNSHPDIVAFSEVFAHDHFGNMPDGGCQNVSTWDSYSTLKLPDLGRWGRLQLYFQYLDGQVFALQHGAPVVGFKMMYGQAIRGFAIPLYLKIRQVSVLHLIRWNHLDVLLSEEGRKIRKYYHASRDSEVAPIQIYIEPETLEYRLEQRDDFIRQACRSFQQLGVPYCELVYEDLLRDDLRIRAVLDFLAVESHTEALCSPLRKLNSTNHRELIANYEDVVAALRHTRFADLLHESGPN